ncbi:MAG: hypothetical protein M1838_005045 [Thelocarpon superellum]|nr:MAG: hypothetical protein M1838_005045 [Thelocarpon superellum]
MSANPLDALTDPATSFPPRDSSLRRPHPSPAAHSFPRLDSPAEPSTPIRPRASTLQVDRGPLTLSPVESASVSSFDRGDAAEGLAGKWGEATSKGETPSPISRSPSYSGVEVTDELPIELISLSDRFIDSLSAKVHPSPPSVDKLSELFQDFYVLAASHIATHISALSSRQHRDSSPSPRVLSRSSSATTVGGRTVSGGSRSKAPSGSEQQLLTTTEIDDRRKARRLLEKKRLLLEEAVERRVCEAVYERIWRHRSTHDEEMDEKLRSRTAALGVVGIGLDELGIQLLAHHADGTPVQETDVRHWLSEAREQLMRMNDERCPLGKLLHLKAAHKGIVDTLSRVHPTSSSADEILPTMIYTLITTPSEGINVISNLYFIQRFRAESKMDGEAAYCLTNLEAAITFLENVDLPSLRASEKLSGPPKSVSNPSTPEPADDDLLAAKGAKSAPRHPPGAPIAMIGVQAGPETLTKPPAPSVTLSRPSTATSHQRRLSELLQPHTHAIGAASDAVINTADQGFKTIGSTLENSYNLLFGRLKERQLSGTGIDDEGKVVVPKTLDDARKLVDVIPATEDDGTASVTSSNAAEQKDGQGADASVKGHDRALSLIGGLGMARERSSDSTRSSGSGRRTNMMEEMTGVKEIDLTTPRVSVTSHPASSPAVSALNPAVESMRHLGNSLNPLNRLPSINVMRTFGRSTPTAATPPTATLGTHKEVEGINGDAATDSVMGGVAGLTTAFPDLAASLPPKEGAKVAPPIRKFMEIDNPGELKISEVLELLRDYRRLAGALRTLGAV